MMSLASSLDKSKIPAMGYRQLLSTSSNIIHHLTVKTEGEVADERADPPTVIQDISLYNDFFTRPELYHRVHVHLVGVRAKDPENKHAGLSSGLLGKCDSSATVETFGADTGSTDYFPIGLDVLTYGRKSGSLPIWDARTLLIGKKGIENTEGIKFSVTNHHCKKQKLLECTVPAIDFPAAGEDWKDFVYTPEDSKHVKDVELLYKIRVTNCEDKISDRDDLGSFLVDTESISYSEEVIKGEEKVDNALLQCWRQKKEPASKAVLWIMGRNDCFMHPNVAKELFTEKGYDLYVLNYSANGMCRKRGWVDSALFNSHNRKGTFDLYLDQVGGAIAIIQSQKSYKKTVGYAHSTGAPVLINYLMQKGDDAFDGFIFNSPFLYSVGGELADGIVGNVTQIQPMSNDCMLGEKKTPEELKDTPIVYLGDEIVISAWSAKLWSQHYFDYRCRPMYTVPKTVGFAKGVSYVHKTILKWKKEKKYVTLKPFICIASRADDVLTSSEETLSRIDYVGPSRCEVELSYNAHDVFLSDQGSNVKMAVTTVRNWMETHGFE